MAVDQPSLPRTASAGGTVPQAEHKARGANRSTKVAGKLKVLPDQPDPVTQSKVLSEPPKSTAEETTSGNNADSEEEEGEDDELEELDVEV